MADPTTQDLLNMIRALQERLDTQQTAVQPGGQTVPAGHNVLADLGDALSDFEQHNWYPRNLVVRDIFGNPTTYSLFGKLLAHVGVPDAVLISMTASHAIETILGKYDIPAHVLEQVQHLEHVIGFDRAKKMLLESAGQTGDVQPPTPVMPQAIPNPVPSQPTPAPPDLQQQSVEQAHTLTPTPVEPTPTPAVQAAIQSAAQGSAPVLAGEETAPPEEAAPEEAAPETQQMPEPRDHGVWVPEGYTYDPTTDTYKRA